MKTNYISNRHPLLRQYAAPLLCVTLALAPVVAQARMGGGRRRLRTWRRLRPRRRLWSQGQLRPPGTRAGTRFQAGCFSHERSDNRFGRLSDHLLRRSGTPEELRHSRDRFFRTRDFLLDLEDAGWPEDLIDTWSDACAQDEIVNGMPAPLVLDYWGTPIATESVVISGAPHSAGSTTIKLAGRSR